jgi:hypothetical protein
MSKKATTLVGTLFGRLRSFLQDFLPANNLQLLFPLASLVIYVGASYPWLPPGHVLSSPQYEHQDGTLWFDISTRFLMLRYYAILFAAHFSRYRVHSHRSSVASAATIATGVAWSNLT